MKINISEQPDPDIFHDRKKYALWFAFFLVWTFIAIAIALFSIYSNSSQNLEDWALGVLVASAVGITWPGSKLQTYKKLIPPQWEELEKLRAKHPQIEKYCAEVEATGRRLVRAEYEASVEYAERHSAAPFI